ncbi:hypothetical protein ZIOFF_015200 [Zingiber officinale]|uniref:Uncharacterized protein n=1 Tax=Zingiber officinale TaxID=94328 RepID=A0A8J5HCP0_ZINOF|nr:hypothetical protein ZIOFF_015200 [Zingiber officinale]
MASSSFASISKRLISRSLVLPRRQQLFLGAASARSYSTSLSFDPGTPDDSAPQRRVPFQRPLENSLDQGVYKGILVGEGWAESGAEVSQKWTRCGALFAGNGRNPE